MKELIDISHIQLFVRYDNMHLYERLTIRTSKKVFIIDLGNILRVSPRVTILRSSVVSLRKTNNKR